MYCVNCGIQLADTEEKCPICSTLPNKPIRRDPSVPKPYPENRYPEVIVRRGALNGGILFLFVIPLLITFFVDLRSIDGLNWFWYSFGAMLLGYIVFILPLWFHKPNPVIFVPCDFGAAALYLLLIALMTGGGWYLSFALPVTVCAGMIVTAVITLLRYIRKGRLYIFGGAFLAVGAYLLMTEFLLGVTFGISFAGWSIYPLIALSILGSLLIFLAINSAARERMERKLFF